MPPTVYCIFCGTPFTRKWHGSRANVCSPECREAQKKKRKREDYLRSKKSKLPAKPQAVKTIPCNYCRKPFDSPTDPWGIPLIHNCPKCRTIITIISERDYAPIYEIAIPASKARRAGA